MNRSARLRTAGLTGLVAVFLVAQSAVGASATNKWKIGGANTNWTTVGNWNLGHKPTEVEMAQFPQISGNSTLLCGLDTVETVDSVLNDSNPNDYNWLGTGTLNVSNDFLIGYLWHHNYFQPTLKLGGRFQINASWDERGSLKFGNATTYTSGNVFGGGVYNYGKMLYFGGNTSFSNTVLVQSSRLLSFVTAKGNSLIGITKIEGSSSVFGAGTTFDLRAGGTLWFPEANDFSTVSAISFSGGMLRLDAASGYTFPTYAGGFEVNRGMLGIAGNRTLGTTDANGIRLGSTGGFGWLVGGAANSDGNRITRPITLTGNGGVVWVSQYYLNADMNFATAITGPGMLIKTGEKTLFLRNVGNGTVSSYSGGTAVAGGALYPESSRTLGSGDVAIAPGGLLYLNQAAQLGAGATVRVGGDMTSPGVLRLLSDQAFPTFDTNSTGVIALEVNNTHTLSAVGSAFLGSANNGANYSSASLPVGVGNTYRIGYLYSLYGGGGWQQMLTLDVNGGHGGTGALTGDHDLLVAYCGAFLRDFNTFTGTTTVRKNLAFNGWTCAWLEPAFMTGGSSFGSEDGAVRLFHGGLFFQNDYAADPASIRKGALTVQGQNAIYMGTIYAITSTVTFASINREKNGQLSLGTQSPLGGQAQLYATAAPTPTHGMVEPWLVYGWNGNGTFLNYGSTGYAPAAYHVTVPAGNFPSLINGTNVVQVTGSATLVDNPDIHALRADAAVNGAANTVTLRSGGLILNNALTHSANFTFGVTGDAEGIVYNPANTTLSGILTTSVGLTKGGPGVLTLTGINTNTLRGDIVVNGGTLKATSTSYLCYSTNRIILNGGAFDGGGNANWISRTFGIGPAGGYLYTTAYNGIIEDETPGTAGGPLVIVSGHQAWIKRLNTFTAPLILLGSARCDGNASPGRGPVTIMPGSVMTLHGYGGIDSIGRYTLHAGNSFASLVFDNDNGNPSTARTYRIGSLEGSGNVTFGAGYQNPPANSKLVVGNDNTSCDYYGNIMQWGPGGNGYTVIKEGTGTWTLWGNGMWLGPLVVSNGTMQVHGAIERVYSLTVKTGATLGGHGYIAAPTTVDAGGTLAGSLVFASNVTLDAGATNSVTLNDPNTASPTGGITLNSGTLNFNGCALNVRLLSRPTPEQEFRIVNNVGGTVTGTPFAQAQATVKADFEGQTYLLKVAYTPEGITLTAMPGGTILQVR